MTDLRLNINHQLLEDLERFPFVFNQGVSLPVGAEADTVAQTVHRIEMLLPEPVDGAQDGIPLNLPQGIRVLKTYLQLVGLPYTLGDEGAHRELSRAETVVE